MKMHGVIILLILIVCIVPAYFINRWLQRMIRPRESFARLLLYFLGGFALAFCYTFLVVWIIGNLFPLPKR